MSNIFKPVDQPHFHRDFANDLPKQVGPDESLATRVVSAALPVLSLYRPFGRALSMGSSASRLFFAGQELDQSFAKAGNLALSVAAVAGTVFYSSVGTMITTSHDILLNLHGLATSDQKLLEGVKLLNNVVYMSLLCCGGLEVQIASLATQAFLNMASSANEYSKGRYFEAGTNLLLTGVRAKQMQGCVDLLRNNWKIEAMVRNIIGNHKVTGTHCSWDPYTGDNLEFIEYKLDNDTWWGLSYWLKQDLDFTLSKGGTVNIEPILNNEPEHRDGKRYWMCITGKSGETIKVPFYPPGYYGEKETSFLADQRCF